MEERPRSSIRRVHGGDEEWRKKVEDHFDAVFSGRRWYPELERKKSSKELRIIRAVVPQVEGFLAQFGAKPLNITARQIHMLSLEKMSPEMRQRFEQEMVGERGRFNSFSQRILIPEWRHRSHLSFANTLVHELVHFHSYSSMRRYPDTDVPRQKSTGLHTTRFETANAGADEFFARLNEAVTEELAKRISKGFEDVPELRREYAPVADAIRKYPDIDIAEIHSQQIKTADGPQYEAESYGRSYPESRRWMWGLIEEICAKDPARSTEEVFTVFAKAAMTGKIKDMSGMIEGLGRGKLKEVAALKPDDEYSQD